MDALATGWAAGLIALFLWWFSTGVILMIVKHADRADAGSRTGPSAHLRATMLGLPVLALGWLGFIGALEDPSVAGVYVAFLSALMIWGWFELAFLCGVLTGPNEYPSPPEVAGWERFLRAWGAIAYSEMALIATMITVAILANGAANAFGVWAFAILFFARISAKLNLYLGVPNVNVEFLPQRMRHLASHFRIAPLNGLFPISVMLLTFAVGCWLERLWAAPAGSGEAVGFALLAALTALALLEHWLMVLPLPDARLWRWMLPPEPADAPPPRVAFDAVSFREEKNNEL